MTGSSAMVSSSTSVTAEASAAGRFSTGSWDGDSAARGAHATRNTSNHRTEMDKRLFFIFNFSLHCILDLAIYFQDTLSKSNCLDKLLINL
jgi:hypothetical protein